VITRKVTTSGPALGIVAVGVADGVRVRVGDAVAVREGVADGTRVDVTVGVTVGVAVVVGVAVAVRVRVAVRVGVALRVAVKVRVGVDVRVGVRVRVPVRVAVPVRVGLPVRVGVGEMVGDAVGAPGVSVAVGEPSGPGLGVPVLGGAPTLMTVVVTSATLNDPSSFASAPGQSLPSNTAMIAAGTSAAFTTPLQSASPGAPVWAPRGLVKASRKHATAASGAFRCGLRVWTGGVRGPHANRQGTGASF
jgi:hypothetical protein